ncbi:hypothetical protein M011DRAFT_379943, partial [Sporormia fimetaria CBS 119925]
WRAYNTTGSIGPAYQLPIFAHNATSTLTYLHTHHPHTNWTLRIDDQALIASSLLTPTERQYQSWYATRYPETALISRRGDYINSTWLASPEAENVPVDDMFHFSHCVLAVKRYILARETGRHVCGRDIDREHVGHCLEALDWWAFPSEGRVGDAVENVRRGLSWRTKI